MSSPSKSPSKSAIIARAATEAKVDKKAVAAVLASLEGQATETLKAGDVFKLPGLVTLKSKATPATVDRAGVNPFTKQPTTIKGKPASFKVRATPAKSIKVAVAS